MSEATNNLVLEHLRHIRTVGDNIYRDVKELRTRVSLLEEGYVRLEAQYVHISSRMDGLDMRLERVERRLGLIEV